MLDQGLVFGLRRALGLAVNVRRFTGLAGGDVMVVRENSEGLYFAPGTVLHAGTDAAIATEVAVTSYAAAERCVRTAFETARERGRRVTLAHKVNVLVASGSVWTQALRAVEPEFPDVAARVENVDTCCLRLVQDPARYDVIVTDNVFGDVVADVACAALDAFAYSASAEYGPVTSLFEPIHGPQDGVGDPHPVSVVAAVRAAALLASHVGHDDAARLLDEAALTAARDPGSDPLETVRCLASAATA